MPGWDARALSSSPKRVSRTGVSSDRRRLRLWCNDPPKTQPDRIRAARPGGPHRNPLDKTGGPGEDCARSTVEMLPRRYVTLRTGAGVLLTILPGSNGNRRRHWSTPEAHVKAPHDSARARQTSRTHPREHEFGRTYLRLAPRTGEPRVDATSITRRARFHSWRFMMSPALTTRDDQQLGLAGGRAESRVSMFHPGFGQGWTRHSFMDSPGAAGGREQKSVGGDSRRHTRICRANSVPAARSAPAARCTEARPTALSTPPPHCDTLSRIQTSEPCFCRGASGGD